MNNLESLRSISTVVADTGDVTAIRQHKPTDATTNPSLLLQVAQSEAGDALIQSAISRVRKRTNSDPSASDTLNELLILVGSEIVSIVPRYVSTEVDARLSYDTEATIRRAHDIIKSYDDAGVSSDRVLIKIASTWEGIRAASVLEASGIRCNMTLLFSLTQAMACADAGVTLISPFVGRIFDWYCKKEGVTSYTPDEDPGVQSVRRIYTYLKSNRFKTEVMAASFRNSGEILALAGCDLLTIAPKFLDELDQTPGEVVRVLDPAASFGEVPSRELIIESRFRLDLNEDAMANDLLSDGIRRFAADQVKLETLIQSYSGKNANAA